ncbi:hypothetical protein [Paraburkholderia fynbosensis]|uniref:Uncharacterized protein n=1 Tax=Paraburkholderia fynbosensis TaxID=1200993 RepID=A0A6J5H809_9BURK|nr:hypothetical protein [Paraburkholderia fynbosensis]CAB3810543.1 hypothetical protein LMG27177_07279 [Paraburkholderia fynbosensis]
MNKLKYAEYDEVQARQDFGQFVKEDMVRSSQRQLRLEQDILCGEREHAD